MGTGRIGFMDGWLFSDLPITKTECRLRIYSIQVSRHGGKIYGSADTARYGHEPVTVQNKGQRTGLCIATINIRASAFQYKYRTGTRRQFHLRVYFWSHRPFYATGGLYKF